MTDRSPVQRATRIAWFVAGALVVSGVGVFSLRSATRRERLPKGQSVWQLDYEVEFRADEPGAELRVFLPVDTQRARIIRDDIRRAQLSAAVVGDRAGGSNRELAAVATRAQRYRITVSEDIHVNERARWRRAWRGRRPGVRGRPELAAEPNIEVGDKRVVAAVDAIAKQQVTPDAILTAIHRQVIAYADRPEPHSAAAVIAAKGGSALGRARAFVALARAAHIPARLVVGFHLHEAQSAEPSVWVEVKRDKTWLSFEPGGRFAGRRPPRYMPVRRGGSDVVEGRGVSQVSTKFEIMSVEAPRSLRQKSAEGVRSAVDLTRLPKTTQHTLALLLILPFGALLTAFARNVIGIKTFGTFAPALFALSFVYAELSTGVVLLFVILALSVFGRGVLEALKLLMIPRLAIVLTVVVISMVMTISIADYYEVTPSARAIILPMVILTTLTERIYVITEEDGVRETLLRSAGTLVVAVGCVLLFEWSQLRETVLAYPEIHFGTAAALVLIGRYVGYKLTELWRFADLAAMARGDRKDGEA